MFSADLDGVQEFNRRKTTPGSKFADTAPHHIVTPTLRTLDHCLSLSDVVVSGVPSDDYKVDTDNLKDGVVAVNFSSAKNFGPEIKQKASIYVPAIGKVTIMMLQRNLLVLFVYIYYLVFSSLLKHFTSTGYVWSSTKTKYESQVPPML